MNIPYIRLRDREQRLSFTYRDIHGFNTNPVKLHQVGVI